MSHVDFVFPTSLSYTSSGGPRTKTTINEFPETGDEVRHQRWQRSRWDFNLVINKINLVNSKIHTRFFLNRHGEAQSFLFQDFNDYQLADQWIGYGDGSEQTFQLLNHYEDVGSYPITAVSTGSKYFEIEGDKRFHFQADADNPEYFRVGDSTGNDQWYTIDSVALASGDTRIGTVEAIADDTVDGNIYPAVTRIIQKPILSSVVVKQNGTPVSSGSISHDNLGNITFTTSNGATITVSCDFYSVVRLGIEWNELKRIRPNTNQSITIPLIGQYLTS